MISEEESKANENCELTSDTVAVMSKLTIMKNLIILSLGFLFLFSSFMALANIQSTLNNDGHLGVISQSAIYAALIISSLFLPKLIIKKIGCKITIVVSMLTYAPYIAANFYQKAWTLLPTAILLGLGAGTLWSSANTYINNLSFLQADEDAEMAELTTTKFFGIFLIFFQNSQIWGNLVSFLVLKPSTFNSTQNFNDSGKNSLMETTTHHTLSCGATFCGGIREKLQPPSEENKYMLISVYLTLSIIAALIVALFMDPLKESKEVTEIGDGVQSKFAATFKHLKKVDQLLLVCLTIFSGLEQGFLFGDYTEAYITCAWGLQNVGLVFICFGVVNAVMCFVSGTIVKYVPRTVLMVSAAASNFAVCVTLFTWKPSGDNPTAMFVVVGFWAYSDAIWQSQLCALYGVLFRDDAEAAFANYRLWEAMGFMIAFGCSGVLCTSPKIYMQIIFLSIGFAGYAIVEYRILRKKRCYLVPKLL